MKWMNFLIEASYDLGASEMYTFFNVVIPFMYPALFAAGLLVMIVSFDDFLSFIFLRRISYAETLSLYVFSMIRAGVFSNCECFIYYYVAGK